MIYIVSDGKYADCSATYSLSVDLYNRVMCWIWHGAKTDAFCKPTSMMESIDSS